jgi:hypothetical protein
MSLDVYLHIEKGTEDCPHCAQPYAAGETVFDANITHNLSKMASEAGIYEALWRPDEVGIMKAAQLIAPLAEGLAKMKADREHFEKFNSPNGWGMYENFVPWVERYLKACTEYPEAYVTVSR